MTEKLERRLWSANFLNDEVASGLDADDGQTLSSPCSAATFWKRIIFSATWDYEVSRKGMKGVEPKVMA